MDKQTVDGIKFQAIIEKNETSAVIIRLKVYKGRELIDIREHYKRDVAPEDTDKGFTPAGEGKVWQFTGKGVSLDAELIGDLQKAIDELADVE